MSKIKNVLKFFLRLVPNLVVFFIVFNCVFLLLVFVFGVFHSNYTTSLPTDAIRRNPVIHQIFPNTRWSSVKPCAEYINEQEQFNKAKFCSNVAFTLEYNKSLPENLSVPPRCFVLPHGTPDVFFSEEYLMNFTPIRVGPLSFAFIVGLYDKETETIFLVENHDVASIYRHELQHYFQHKLDPNLLKQDHGGSVWNVCESPRYSPSEEQKSLYREQLKLIRNQ